MSTSIIKELPGTKMAEYTETCQNIKLMMNNITAAEKEENKSKKKKKKAQLSPTQS